MAVVKTSPAHTAVSAVSAVSAATVVSAIPVISPNKKHRRIRCFTGRRTGIIIGTLPLVHRHHPPVDLLHCRMACCLRLCVGSLSNVLAGWSFYRSAIDNYDPLEDVELINCDRVRS